MLRQLRSPGRSGAHATCSRGRRHRTRAVHRHARSNGGTSGACCPCLTYATIFHGFEDVRPLILESSGDSATRRRVEARCNEKFNLGRGENILSSVVRNYDCGTFERGGTWRSGRILPTLGTLGALVRDAPRLICLRDSSLDATRLFEWTRVACR